jgi:hypothetical protein
MNLELICMEDKDQNEIIFFYLELSLSILIFCGRILSQSDTWIASL